MLEPGAATSVEGRRSAQGVCPHANDHELEVVSDEKFSKQPQNVIDIATALSRNNSAPTSIFTL